MFFFESKLLKSTASKERDFSVSKKRRGGKVGGCYLYTHKQKKEVVLKYLTHGKRR